MLSPELPRVAAEEEGLGKVLTALVPRLRVVEEEDCLGKILKDICRPALGCAIPPEILAVLPDLHAELPGSLRGGDVPEL